MFVAATAAVKSILFVFFLVLVPLVPVTFVFAKRLSSRRTELATGRDAATPFRLITWIGVTVTTAVLVVVLIVLGAQLAFGSDDDSVDPRKGNESPAFSDPSDTQTVQGNAAAGRAVFANSGCGDCHMLTDADANGTSAPSLDDSQPDFTTVVGAITTGPGEMPDFSGRLSAAQIRDVAKYVSTVAGRQ